MDLPRLRVWIARTANPASGAVMANPTTQEKALHINLDATRYGTFAEIGAGQEVARWFFHVGGAAGTVAKTISAYDTAVSDALYGRSDRYVSRQRLQAMLDREYALLLERLGPGRGDRTLFFVLADTVATRSYSRHENGQGWLGATVEGTARLWQDYSMVQNLFPPYCPKTQSLTTFEKRIGCFRNS